MQQREQPELRSWDQNPPGLFEEQQEDQCGCSGESFLNERLAPGRENLSVD